MKIELTIELKMKDNIWKVFLEKEMDLEFLPDINEEVIDNGLNFRVKDRTFDLKGQVNIHLEQLFELVNNNDRKQDLMLMQESGWTYRGNSDLTNLMSEP